MSTGYALGFLAIMRSEISAKPGSSTIIPRVLEKILTFSLPAEEKAKIAFDKSQLSGEVAAKPSECFCSEDQTVHSSSSVLMEQCKRLLEQSLNGTHDWNIIDGALLAINALVKTSDTSKKGRIQEGVSRNGSLNKSLPYCHAG
jgi:hypothetical protein